MADDPRYRFVHGDIADADAVAEADRRACDAVVNFAAESHVDRSILDPAAFIRTNVVGTHVLLDAAREPACDASCRSRPTRSTALEPPAAFTRGRRRCSPSSPYSASKAGGDLLVLAYAPHLRPADAVITRGSNNYGPYQFPEKLIPLFVTNALDGQPLPVYGDGLQVRDWIHVDDHCAGIWTRAASRARPARSTTSAAATRSRTSRSRAASSRSPGATSR